MKNIIIQVLHKNNEWVNVDTRYLIDSSGINVTTSNKFTTLEIAKILLKAYETVFPQKSFKLVQQKYIDVKIGEE